MPASDSTRPEVRLLMLRDREVARVSLSPDGRVVRVTSVEPDLLPIGCLDEAGRPTRARVQEWIARRAIPTTRAGLPAAERALGIGSPRALLLSGLGLGLSDQYWLRPEGSDLSWSRVNFFDNTFGDELGLALAPHDERSAGPRLRALEAVGPGRAASSPDAALSGNLRKRWRVAPNGTRQLVKGGKDSNLRLEPLAELAATELCSRILLVGEYVPYEVQAEPGYGWVSVCPCMVDSSHALVSAFDISRGPGFSKLRGPRGGMSDFERYVRALEERGIDGAAEQVERMLVVDHVIANSDRHWGNFGVIVDSRTNRWERCAPIFDCGESFWCDRLAQNDFLLPASKVARMPFSRDIHGQLDRFAFDLSWFDREAVEGFPSLVREVFAKSPTLSERRLAGLEAACARTVGDVCRAQDRLARMRSARLGRGSGLCEEGRER